MVQSVSHENFTSVIKFKLSLVSDEGYKSSPRSMEVCVILSKLKIIISLLKQRVSRIFLRAGTCSARVSCRIKGS